MIFLIEYDKSAGKLVSMQTFPDSERKKALDLRLERELELHAQNTRRELTVLQAENEAAIRRTHGRYFETLQEILNRKIAV